MISYNKYDEDNKKPTIGMLLDIEHLYGEHEGRLGPVIITLCLCCVPILFYVYFSLFNYIPIWLFIPFEILFSIRVVMKVPGREGYRVNIFKRRLYDNYTPTAKLMNIKTIHPDGCVEYINGNVMYIVCCFNGTSDDEVKRSIQLRKLLTSLLGDFIFFFFLTNVNSSPALRAYYDKVQAFNRNESAENFVKIIDHSLRMVEDGSMVQCTIYCVKGKRSDWKDIKTQIDIACTSTNARVYKSISRVSDPVVINEVLNRDIDSVINIEDLLRRKYKTGDYDTSRVLAYDLPDDKVIIQGKKRQEPIIPEAPKSSFHVKYTGD